MREDSLHAVYTLGAEDSFCRGVEQEHINAEHTTMLIDINAILWNPADAITLELQLSQL